MKHRSTARSRREFLKQARRLGALMCLASTARNLSLVLDAPADAGAR